MSRSRLLAIVTLRHSFPGLRVMAFRRQSFPARIGLAIALITLIFSLLLACTVVSSSQARIRALPPSILVWGTMLGLASGTAAWAIAKYFCFPLVALTAASERIQQGDNSAFIPTVAGTDEVAQLSVSINRLVLTLNEQKHRLETLNASLEQQILARTDKLKRLNKRLSQEIEERKQTEMALWQANHELKRLTIVDGLTGVANRRRFDEYLAQEWRRLAREQAPLSLILCDVDYFKLYNDTYGHQAGDECLKQVAQAIGCRLKRPADLVTRYGGEEFAVILPLTDAQGALHVASEVRESLKALKIPHSGSAISEYLTLSMGIATVIPMSVLSPTTLVAMADERLYQAKHQGRNCTVGHR